MSSSSNTENKDWIRVTRRRGRKREIFPTPRNTSGDCESWAPADTETNQERQSKLMQKIQSCLEKVRTSRFFAVFLDQIQTQEFEDRFRNVLSSELSMPMVIYGIGSIDFCDRSRRQLSLAILLKRQFYWIGEIEVFDPVLSATECKVLEDLGCSVLSVNEQGRRQARRPTLFFMPHCEAILYDNLLLTNWRMELLNRVVLFGNSFTVYSEACSSNISTISRDSRHILAAQKFVHEFRIDSSDDDYFTAFHDSSWHFFCPNFDSDLDFH